MVNFGFTGLGAEIVEIEDRGKEKILRILSRGITERAAVRGAKNEAMAIIPIRDQEVLNITEDRRISRFSTRYIITIAHNQDEY